MKYITSLIFLCSTLTYADNTLKCTSIPLAKDSMYQKPFFNKGPTNTQWLGGDNDNSISLGGHKYLWTFGDTLLGTYPDKIKNYSYFIHDSIGVMDISNPNKVNMDFYFKKDDKGNPTEFFKPQNTKNGEYFWILSGTAVKNEVLLGLATIVNTPDAFEITDTVYALIENPNAKPNNWKYELFNLDSMFDFAKDFKNVKWNVAMVDGHDGYIYIYGTESNSTLFSKMYLARISMKDILNKDFVNGMEFLTTNDKQWQKYPTSFNSLRGLAGINPTTEATFYYNEDTSLWYSVQIDAFTYNVRLYSSESLYGQWNDEGIIYNIPAPWSTTEYNNQNLFMSYAAKIHPELKVSKNLNDLSFIFEYVNNVDGLTIPGIWDAMGHKIVNDYPSFYIPLFVETKCDFISDMSNKNI